MLEKGLRKEVGWFVWTHIISEQRSSKGLLLCTPAIGDSERSTSLLSLKVILGAPICCWFINHVNPREGAPPPVNLNRNVDNSLG